MHSATALDSTGCIDSTAAKRNSPSLGGAAPAGLTEGTICCDIADRKADVALDCLLSTNIFGVILMVDSNFRAPAMVNMLLDAGWVAMRCQAGIIRHVDMRAFSPSRL